VKEKGEEVIFLRKIVPGKADRSYGVNVARLVGLPDKIINRATQVLENLETQASASGNKKEETPFTGGKHFLGSSFYLNLEKMEGQLSFLPSLDTQRSLNRTEEKVVRELKELNLVNITPLEALNKLFALQARLLSREKHHNEKER
jgi:DNA mismatch repair protein MutS